MPIRRSLHRSHGLVLTLHSGVVEDDEFIEFYRALYRDPDYRLGMHELADLSQVTDFRVSSDALLAVERFAEARYEGTERRTRTAIVAPADLSFGIARIYEALAAGGPEDVVVFRDMPSALAWLGLPDVPAGPGLGLDP